MDRTDDRKPDAQEDFGQPGTPLFQRSTDQEYVLATLKPPGTTTPRRLAA